MRRSFKPMTAAQHRERADEVRRLAKRCRGILRRIAKKLAEVHEYRAVEIETAAAKNQAIAAGVESAATLEG